MFINLWHSILDMPKCDRAFHEQDIDDELKEFHEEKRIIPVWSEASDLVYTYTRGRWSGHKDLQFPVAWYWYLIGMTYMYPKYTLRWLFFWLVARKVNKKVKMREVRNPRKVEKLKVLAEKYGMDEELFVAECKKLLRWWPLLK